jgi:Flp pilus assembly secretin CpaC
VITDQFTSLLAAVAAFNVFQTVNSPTSGGTIGTITGSFTAVPTNPELFNNRQIYFLVTHTTGAGAVEHGIFTTAAGTAFPPNAAAVVSTSVTLSSGASITPIAGGGTVEGNNLQLVQVIPEPSTALLGLIGALGLLRRRR